MTGMDIREEVDNYLIKTREERKNVGLAKVPEFDERDIKQAYRDGMQSGLWHHSYDYLVKTADLKKRYEKQKEINKELVDENEELKKDKDYFSDALDKQIEATLKIDAKLKRAKEIINCLLNVFPYDMPEEELDSGDKDMVKKAEEFLKEEA